MDAVIRRATRKREERKRKAIIGLVAVLGLTFLIAYQPTRMTFVGIGDMFSTHEGRKVFVKGFFGLGNSVRIGEDCLKLVDPDIKRVVEERLGEVTITYHDGAMEQTGQAKKLLDGNMAAGGYYPGTNTIELNSKDLLPSTIIHEYGHALDNALHISESEGFKELAKEEIDSYTGAINIFNSRHYVRRAHEAGYDREYFAEAFLDYHLTPDYLKMTAPLTYAYIDTLISMAKEGSL